MAVWLAAVWGLTGGLCVEALDLYAHIRRTPKWDWRCPIDQGMVAFVVAVVLRVGVGAALAAAFAGSHQVSGPLAAFALGVASPLVVARLAKMIPLSDGQNDSTRSTTATHQVGFSAGGGAHLPVGAEDLAAGESDA